MGVCVPAIENSPILACSFSSQKYAHRAPPGKVLLRIFAGGARHPELAAMDDEPPAADAVGRAGQSCCGSSGPPAYCNIAHWPQTMPQYHVGHKQLVGQIEARVAALPRLRLGRQRLSRRGHSALHPQRRNSGRSPAGREPALKLWSAAIHRRFCPVPTRAPPKSGDESPHSKGAVPTPKGERRHAFGYHRNLHDCGRFGLRWLAWPMPPPPCAAVQAHGR